ncbi:hypothetical protein CBS115989_5893 [Aspergillus niger]|nr:hypothetical protein CBS115989_5893 [Aspergillus niger]KAI2850245.1 hypothetical protein CBS11232_6355 [Aspergillus niger]KAI2876855.1 hypothetical protein CBS115988_4393 [Aspergillus niger]KAI2906550.1 hypothetical protein CBS11852_974 [Aspergillus niger]KAI2929449.1 hypothetical protein CBS147320_3782 [Aspergillus niger]
MPRVEFHPQDSIILLLDTAPRLLGVDELHDPTCSTLKPRVSVDHRVKYRLIHTPLRCQKPLDSRMASTRHFHQSTEHQFGFIREDSIRHNCLMAMKCNLLHSHL